MGFFISIFGVTIQFGISFPDFWKRSRRFLIKYEPLFLLDARIAGFGVGFTTPSISGLGKQAFIKGGTVTPWTK
jgi:hypothetical protein